MPRRRRRWRQRTPEGRPRPAGWWCRSARRRAPCAPRSPTCPFQWPSSASFSTLSCRDWVRRGGRDPCVPGPAAGGWPGRGWGETVGERPRAASVRARAPSAPWQVAAARGAGAPESGAARSYPPRLHLLPPVNEVVPLRRARNFPGNTGARGWRRGWLPPARLGSPPGARKFCPLLSTAHPPASPLF